MVFNLTNQNQNKERVGYFPYAPGINREGEECIMVVCYDHSASGCNPYYWEPMRHNYFGYEFTTQEEAESQAKYARGAWLTKSVNTNESKIGVVRFTTTTTATEIID